MSSRCEERLQDNVRAIVNELKRCTKLHDFENGKRLHLKAASLGCETNKYVATALITMYGKSGSMECARDIFNRMVHRDVVAWNSVIMGYAETGQHSTAVEYFMKMDHEPDTFTFVAVLKACGGLAGEKSSDKDLCLRKGASVHRQIHLQGLAFNVLVSNTLMDMYRKCSAMTRAREVFDQVSHHRNVVSWNCLILGYVENGETRLAFDLFYRMDLQPDHVTYLAVLKACTALASKPSEKQSALLEGVAVHNQLKQTGLDSSLFVSNALLDMYSKCGDMSLARELFESMQTRDVVSWNSLIMGYADNGQSQVALEMFTCMSCQPSLVTFLAVLKACGNVGVTGLESGVEIHERVKQLGLESKVVVANSLLDMYRKCRSMKSARELFHRMTTKTFVSWTCLMLGYVDSGESHLALEVFRSMDCEPDLFTFVAALRACVSLAATEKKVCLQTGMSIHESLKERGYDSDRVVASVLIEMYGKCGRMSSAQEVFDGMVQPDAVVWTCLLLGYVDNGQSMKAIDLFMSMECEPDSLTFVAVLKACGLAGAHLVGRMIHSRVCRLGYEQEEVVSNSLINLYGKVGNMTTAEHLLAGANVKGIVPWNALIAGYTTVGNSFRVFQLGEEVREAGIPMDGITFICLLTACNHAGVVELGRKYFRSMREQGVTPGVDHYNCMVDMLCRANKLQEALEILQSMTFEADSVTWMTLLGACRKWKNVDVGKVAFDELVRLQSQVEQEKVQSDTQLKLAII